MTLDVDNKSGAQALLLVPIVNSENLPSQINLTRLHLDLSLLRINTRKIINIERFVEVRGFVSLCLGEYKYFLTSQFLSSNEIFHTINIPSRLPQAVIFPIIITV